MTAARIAHAGGVLQGFHEQEVLFPSQVLTGTLKGGAGACPVAGTHLRLDSDGGAAPEF